MSGPGKPELVLAPLVLAKPGHGAAAFHSPCEQTEDLPLVWAEPENGAAALQSPCEQTEDFVLHSANTYAWLGVLVSVVDRVANNYVFEPCDGEDRPRVNCNLNLISDIDNDNELTPASQARWHNFSKSGRKLVGTGTASVGWLMT